MPYERIEVVLRGELRRLEAEGRRKGKETVIIRVLPPNGGSAPAA